MRRLDDAKMSVTVGRQFGRHFNAEHGLATPRLRQILPFPNRLYN